MPAKARNLDFTNVKERSFNTKNLPEGDYPAKVTKVEDAKSKQGNSMWVFTIALTSASGKGATYPYHCVLNADNLWKVRNLFAAAGLNIPKKKLGLDPNKVLGKPIGVTLEDDEYEGKPKSVIAAVIPVAEIVAPGDDEEDGDEEVEAEDELDESDAEVETEDEAPKAKKKKNKKAKPAVDEDELEELEVEDL